MPGFGSRGGFRSIGGNKDEVLQTIGFGSRGGFRETGVLKNDDPMEKPTATTPVWAPQPTKQEPTQNESRS
ncbi:MAG: hypothetical protein RL292_480 [Candidatus Parcubacteria bacterium]|jgi:hypothetical protein